MALRRTFTHNAPAFTLLEVLIVMAIFIMVAGFGLFVSLDTFRGYSFRNERDVVVSVLNKARSQSINNMCFGTSCTDGKAHGVYFGVAGNYVVFQGASYATRDTALDEVVAASHKGATVTGTSEVVFAPLSAVVASPATITVTADSHSSVITVGTEGQVVWTH